MMEKEYYRKTLELTRSSSMGKDLDAAFVEEEGGDDDENTTTTAICTNGIRDGNVSSLTASLRNLNLSQDRGRRGSGETPRMERRGSVKDEPP